MGQLLKIAGVAYLIWLKFGDNVTSAILDGIEYKFSTLRQRNIRLDVNNGEFYGLLRIELQFKQSLGLNLSAQQLTLELRQQGQYLGKVSVNESVVLPNAKFVSIPVDAVIPGGGFLDRLQEILVNPNARWQAPIDITGTVTLSNGLAVPVFTSLDFMNL